MHEETSLPRAADSTNTSLAWATMVITLRVRFHFSHLLVGPRRLRCPNRYWLCVCANASFCSTALSIPPNFLTPCCARQHLTAPMRKCLHANGQIVVSLAMQASIPCQKLKKRSRVARKHLPTSRAGRSKTTSSPHKVFGVRSNLDTKLGQRSSVSHHAYSAVRTDTSRQR